ncbi:MAG: hypothetical protein ACXVLQ_03700 [Bacteriovorax sp.]
MFNNQIFDSWLNRKADEILSKVNRETITTEEMIVLILKAQTNHFHHMDEEMKSDMNGIHSEMKKFEIHVQEEFQEIRSEMKEFKAEVQEEFQEIRSEMKEFKAEVKDEFKRIDSKLDSRFMWSMGITVTMFLGLYLKLFFG